MATSRHNPPRHPACRRPSAFTLVELLVVVAIIAILISILLPALNGAREQARQAQCLTNLRSMGQAAMLYAQENREWLVRSESNYMHYAAALLPGLGYDGPVSRLWLSTSVEKRLAFRDLCATIPSFQCPRFPEPGQALDYVANAFQFPYTPRNNDDPGQGAGDGPQSSSLAREYFTPLSKLDAMRPAERIFITEAHAAMPTDLPLWGTVCDLFSLRHLPFANTPRVANDQRHPGGVTAVYFDGHAIPQSPLSIDPGWPAPFGDRLRKLTEWAGPEP